MATHNFNPLPPTFILALLLLSSLTFTYVSSARILDEEPPAEEPLTNQTPAASAANVAGSGPNRIPVTPATAPEAADEEPLPDQTPAEEPLPDQTPVASAANAAGSGTQTPVVSGSGPQAGPTQTAVTSGVGPDHTLTFFLHDILGGTNPSALAVTGIVTNPAVNGQVPFAKPNGAVLPVNDNNAGTINNNNNLPFLTGLSGTPSNLIQNNNNNNNIIGGAFGFPALNGAQLNGGSSLQRLMFGTITVFDDELTTGHELGSGLVGKAHGFYVASSEDGTSQTMAFTVMFESGDYKDTLAFFGVHRTAVSESHLAVMGGTGKYVDSKGYATVKTLPGSNQHSTDGMETVLEITVYLAY